MISIEIKKLELKNIWTISRNSSSYKENVFLKIEKDGIIGYGEAAPNVRYGENAQLTQKAIEDAAPLIIKHDFFKYTEIKKIIDELIVGQNCAKDAIDMAVKLVNELSYNKYVFTYDKSSDYNKYADLFDQHEIDDVIDDNEYDWVDGDNHYFHVFDGEIEIESKKTGDIISLNLHDMSELFLIIQEKLLQDSVT